MESKEDIHMKAYAQLQIDSLLNIETRLEEAVERCNFRQFIEQYEESILIEERLPDELPISIWKGSGVGAYLEWFKKSRTELKVAFDNSCTCRSR